MNVVLWVLQGVLAAAFLLLGFAKITGAESMVAAFEAIGAGQWFRYLVGALELLGAVGLLIPRLAGLAGLGLLTACQSGASQTAAPPPAATSAPKPAATTPPAAARAWACAGVGCVGDGSSSAKTLSV